MPGAWPPGPSVRLPAHPPAWPASRSPTDENSALVGGTALPPRCPSVCDPPGARRGLYSLSTVYKWEHLFYEKCNAILLLAWIKLMNVSGEVTLR